MNIQRKLLFSCTMSTKGATQRQLLLEGLIAALYSKLGEENVWKGSPLFFLHFIIVIDGGIYIHPVFIYRAWQSRVQWRILCKDEGRGQQWRMKRERMPVESIGKRKAWRKKQRSYRQPQKLHLLCLSLSLSSQSEHTGSANITCLFDVVQIDHSPDTFCS